MTDYEAKDKTRERDLRTLQEAETYACGYYQKTDTLILVAEISGKRAELIELNLNSKKIIQCRGKWNKQTTDHDRIMNLLKSNLIKIKKCA